MSKQDLLDEQDAIKANSYNIVLWTKKWDEYVQTSKYTHKWRSYKLESKERSNIPKEPGIYTLIIEPGIAQHPMCSYLMYVGKAESLHRRFNDYLTSEKKENGRPKIFRLLNKYEDHILFCFTLVKQSDLDQVEDELIDAYIPTCNDKFKGSLSKTKKAAFP